MYLLVWVLLLYTIVIDHSLSLWSRLKIIGIKKLIELFFIEIVLIAILPIESVLGGHQALEILTVNAAYFLFAYAYIKRHIFNLNSITILNTEVIELNDTENCFS